jgi:predicted DNA-binding transcriptional regulator YafY
MRPDVEPNVSVVHPYGLVAKGGRWYLIGRREDHICVIRVDLIMGLQPMGMTFDRPEDFDLVSFWRSHCKDKMKNRFVYTVSAFVRKEKLDWIIWVLGDRVKTRVLEGDPEGREDSIMVELNFDHFFAALKGILSLGIVIEVTEPLALRYAVQDYAKQIFNVYADSSLLGSD